MSRSVLITGGAGFIGSNLARYLLEQGAAVRVLDNLSRAGVEQNVEMLKACGGRLDFIAGDVCDAQIVREAVRGVDDVYHFAAQVAVTSSISDPRHDLETNLLGTFNVLEAARRAPRPPFLLFTSTNKVYGEMKDVALGEDARRYWFRDRDGVNEDQPLDFHSPYGCSKGAADQYVRDHARIYGLPAVVFRMSCIAGPQQFGNEDQGWLAHFLYSVAAGLPVTIYGDGRQVRDILHVRDLIAAVEAARQHADRTAGHIYNIGGGSRNAASLLEVLELLEQITGRRPRVNFDAPRRGDQRIFVTDFSRFAAVTGWAPRFTLAETARHILEWAKLNHQLLSHAAPGLRGVAAGTAWMAT